MFSVAAMPMQSMPMLLIAADFTYMYSGSFYLSSINNE